MCMQYNTTSLTTRGSPRLVWKKLFVVSLCAIPYSVMSLSTTTTKPKNIVVVGGGIQGTSVAYHLAERISKQQDTKTTTRITLIESIKPASAASGKGGGFMARSWGDGSPTQGLHHLAFDMYETLAAELDCKSYRKLPVLSVSPGYDGGGVKAARKNKQLAEIMPDWLDGKAVGRINAMGWGDDTAQITPSEFVEKMLAKHKDRIQLVLGTVTGVETADQGSARGGSRKITAVCYQDAAAASNDEDCVVVPADAIVVSAGPWSCAAEDWFQGAGLQLPMEGIKSTSIVWKKPSPQEVNESDDEVDATALFCGEDNRFGTHLEVYPRPDGTIYICGIGGSDYISKEDLKQGAFRKVCDSNDSRVAAAKASFEEMSSFYKKVGELDRTQACMRPCPSDALPYMGPVPGYEGAFINAGHNCWGIAWAPACGKAIAELVLDGKATSVDLSPFDPARFTPSAGRGTRGRKRRGANVGEQW